MEIPPPEIGGGLLSQDVEELWRPEATWTAVNMTGGPAPWQNSEAITALYSGSDDPSDGLYDYSEAMTGPGSHLCMAVHDVLRRTLPGIFVGAEFRQVPYRPQPVRLELQAEHSIPFLEPCRSPPPVTDQAYQLRPDQQAGLEFLLAAEQRPQTLTASFSAFVRRPSAPIAVGGLAKFTRFVSLGCLDSETRARFTGLPMHKLKSVLDAPGRVTDMTISEREIDLVTLIWTLQDWRFSCAVPKARLESASSPCERCVTSLGDRVRLREPDTDRHILSSDIGVVIEYEASSHTVAVSFPTCFVWRGPVAKLVGTVEPLTETYVEFRVHVKYNLYASISAQKMGWGKTRMVVAFLEAATRQCAGEGGHSRTLILLPPTLFEQWLDELRGWFQITDPSRRWMITPDPKCRIRIWAPLDIGNFQEIDAERALKAHIVVLPYALLTHPRMPKSDADGPALKRARVAPAPCFNPLAIPWNRLVLDEAHELWKLPAATQRWIFAVRREATHLLSGTPQQGLGSRGAASLALLMGASLCPTLASWYSCDGEAAAEATAAQLFARFARFAVSPFAAPVEENVLYVQLSDAEKVLYANRQRQGSSDRELLNLCCCFLSETSSSANKEIGVLIKQKTRELQFETNEARMSAALTILLARATGDVARLSRRMSTLSCRADARKEIWAVGQQVVSQIYEDLREYTPEALCELVLACAVRGSKTHALLVTDKPGLCLKEQLVNLVLGRLDRDEVSRAFGEQLDAFLGREYLPIGCIKAPLDFLQQSLAEIGGSCSICLDDLDNGTPSCITPCGHAFHVECAELALQARGQCSICRQEVRQLYNPKPAAPADPFLKYGTKIKVMVEQLQTIKEDYPGERVLLFVQHKPMRLMLEKAFSEFKVPFLTLAGSTRKQGKAIARWQSGSDPEDFLLVLSCQEHTSGITLTAASQVMFVHPMLANSVEEADDLERQAIGRVNRLGQKKIIKIWRVITKDTIEDTIAQRQKAARARRTESADVQYKSDRG